MEFPEVIIVARCLIERDEKVLLLKRTEDRKYNPGKWELPGGKIEAGQDLEKATEREALEETGLLVRLTSFGTVIESKTLVGERHGEYEGKLYLELVSRGEPVSGSVKLEDEHSEYSWTTLEDALNLDLSFEARKAITFFSES